MHHLRHLLRRRHPSYLSSRNCEYYGAGRTYPTVLSPHERVQGVHDNTGAKVLLRRPPSLSQRGLLVPTPYSVGMESISTRAVVLPKQHRAVCVTLHEKNWNLARHPVP